MPCPKADSYEIHAWLAVFQELGLLLVKQLPCRTISRTAVSVSQQSIL